MRYEVVKHKSIICHFIEHLERNQDEHHLTRRWVEASVTKPGRWDDVHKELHGQTPRQVATTSQRMKSYATMELNASGSLTGLNDAPSLHKEGVARSVETWKLGVTSARLSFVDQRREGGFVKERGDRRRRLFAARVVSEALWARDSDSGDFFWFYFWKYFLLLVPTFFGKNRGKRKPGHPNMLIRCFCGCQKECKAPEFIAQPTLLTSPRRQEWNSFIANKSTTIISHISQTAQSISIPWR